MIFLIPILLIIAIIFGIDYIYFDDKTSKKEPIKTEQNSTLEKEKQEYIESLFNKSK